MKSVMKMFATVFGVGYVPLAPGTAGSVIGFLLYYVLRGLPLQHYILFVITFIFFASWVATWGAHIFGEEDPKRVVIDEVAGSLVTMMGHSFSWVSVLAGFILFRIFDVAKPFPIGAIEKRIKGGFGIVLDDVMAGVYSNIAIWILIFLAAKAGLKLF